MMTAIPEVLGGEPMTRDVLANAIAEHTKLPKLRDLIVESSWGSPLKPAAFRGDLCFGPSQGQNITFVNPRKWLGKRSTWDAVEPEAAIREVILRYLRAYGPSTLKDFALWWWGGGGLTQGKKAFKSLDDELVAVDVEGYAAFALRDTLEPLQNLEPSESIQLLPLFDAYTLGIGRDIEPLLPKTHKLRVYRPQGWITAVVLVNGSIKGVWNYKTQRGQTVVNIELFSTPTTAIKQGIEAEVERLGVFLNTAVALEIVVD
jgi:hypothetical protein